MVHEFARCTSVRMYISFCGSHWSLRDPLWGPDAMRKTQHPDRFRIQTSKQQRLAIAGCLRATYCASRTIKWKNLPVFAFHFVLPDLSRWWTIDWACFPCCLIPTSPRVCPGILYSSLKCDAEIWIGWCALSYDDTVGVGRVVYCSLHNIEYAKARVNIPRRIA